MASLKYARQVPANSVFINCPFDPAYKPLIRAIIFTIIASGYSPRCALDAEDSAEIRIQRITNMIGACDWGIHDISRVELSKRLPRFNMPLELGIHFGARWLGAKRHRKKRALVLDSIAHRYDISLSDISGQDIRSHNNKPRLVMRRVRDWLSEHRRQNEIPLPGADSLWRDYRKFQREIPIFLKRNELGTLDQVTHNDYLYVVRDWLPRRGGATPRKA
jgi:hypothetical protein